MIGIVITAHGEAEHIGATLAAVTQAATHPALHGELVRVMVVLDSCDDATDAIAETHGAAHGVKTLPLSARNVGMARAAGATRMLDDGARCLAASLPRCLAFTDADTLVSPDWLVKQLAQEADAVCNSIGIDDWSAHGPHGDFVRNHFERTYSDADGHRHIHGAPGRVGRSVLPRGRLQAAGVQRGRGTGRGTASLPVCASRGARPRG